MQTRLLGTALVVSLAVGSLYARDRDDRDVHGVARAGSRPEPNAVVWIEAPNAVASTETPRRIVLTQRNMAFLPHVLAVRVGATVEFPNEDRVFHNVFSFHDNKPFDLGTYPVGSSKHVAFTQPGVSRLFCNIHPHMSGYVVAVDSSYFATASADGTFTIPRVPPGHYTYRAWRPGGPVLTGTAVLPSASLLMVTWR